MVGENSDRAKESDVVKIMGQAIFSASGVIILSKEQVFSLLKKGGYSIGDGFDYEFIVKKKQSGTYDTN